MKTLRYKSSFVTFNRAIGLMLDTEDPFTTNKVLVWSGGNKGLGVVF